MSVVFAVLGMAGVAWVFVESPMRRVAMTLWSERTEWVCLFLGTPLCGCLLHSALVSVFLHPDPTRLVVAAGAIAAAASMGAFFWLRLVRRLRVRRAGALTWITLLVGTLLWAGNVAFLATVHWRATASLADQREVEEAYGG